VFESRIHVSKKNCSLCAFFKNSSENHHLEKKRVISKNADNNIGFSVLYLHTRYHFHGFGQNVIFLFFGQVCQNIRNQECKQKLNCV
jgi:hypothetical protein